MLEIAIKMLFGDRAKYLMLVSAIAFCSLLMTQQSSVFTGLMLWTTATIRNTNVPIWVMDPKVQQVNEVKPMRDTDAARVRSVKGVAWAIPFYFSIQQARLYDGRFRSIQMIGLDATTLIGAPSVMLQGKITDLWQADSVILDQVGIEKLSEGRPKPIEVGDIFEINDHEVRIVGICQVARSFFGYPYVYTTYDRALEIVPKTRKNLSFILVKPQEGVPQDLLAQEITKETGLKALTENTFFWDTIIWFIKNTGIPVSFGTTILLGFLVGVAVSGQTFYSFILENMGNIGALKAMGATNSLLFRMLIAQSLFVGITGYGIGIGLASVFGFMTLKTGQPPFYLPYQVLVLTLCFILFICMFSAWLGIRKIRKLEPAEVFRG
ncbi:ABC transporter permease [Estrella lausannensis]|uniref:ABC-type transporter, permease subunit n=1 Tax=Estrella lausannensis TaxID=483423 RepID=A0A0H5DPV4_9BACT|nr:ABC transporter permease [Estrella lausannensis]CRX38611.1 ABC-type transporter, permease subunit [Estrella lausannensis]